MIVGNMVDNENRRRVMKDQPIKDYKERFGFDCWEVSAKTGDNVSELFC
jgi:hypothetical protein